MRLGRGAIWAYLDLSSHVIIEVVWARIASLRGSELWALVLLMAYNGLIVLRIWGPYFIETNTAPSHTPPHPKGGLNPSLSLIWSLLTWGWGAYGCGP